jgi:FixJ family two-component response regulator
MAMSPSDVGRDYQYHARRTALQPHCRRPVRAVADRQPRRRGWNDRRRGARAGSAGRFPREQEVLDALLAGRPNKVIAFDLSISVRTVEVHLARMMGRLGTKQFADAIRLAVMAKLATKNRTET